MGAETRVGFRAKCTLLLLSDMNEHWNGFTSPLSRFFQRFRVVSWVRTDGNADFDVRSAGMQKRLKRNEGGVDTEGSKQGIKTQIEAHVCGASLKFRVLWVLELMRTVRGLHNEAVTATSCFLLKSNPYWNFINPVFF
jgi:hypothetical protein